MPWWSSRSDDDRTENCRRHNRESNSGWLGRRREDEESTGGFRDFEIDVRGGVAPIGKGHSDDARSDPSWDE